MTTREKRTLLERIIEILKENWITEHILEIIKLQSEKKKNPYIILFLKLYRIICCLIISEKWMAPSLMSAILTFWRSHKP